MILKGNERGHGKELAKHLLNARDNEHVELHDLRGFVSDDLYGAMRECEAVARGTRCKNHLFSLSLNPPENEDVPVEVFESAIDRIETQLGLTGQPRAIVFHEKEGRRHAHAVWSRINGQEMKAINLPHYKRKLNEIAHDLYHKHGWQLPEGFKDKRNRDPLAFTLAEWQQAKRLGGDPKLTKSLIRECWSESDSAQAFEAALQDKGFWLARGNPIKRVSARVDGTDSRELLQSFTQAASEAAQNRVIHVDVEKYQHLLDDSGMSEAQKREVLEALWSMIVAFVDLGFGVHPVQESCGKVLKGETEPAQADSGMLDSRDTERKIE